MANIYTPPWAKPGCTVVCTWQDVIHSGGAEGWATFVRYTDSKGKEQECMKWVKWVVPYEPTKYTLSHAEWFYPVSLYPIISEESLVMMIKASDSMLDRVVNGGELPDFI